MEVRPKDNEELEKQAAIGVIRASRFVRKYARTRDKIDVSAIKSIHREIWKDVWPDIAGEYRIEDLKISDSKLLLPHYSEVTGLMKEADEKRVTLAFIIQIEQRGNLSPASRQHLR